MADTTTRPAAERVRPTARTVLPGVAMVAVTFGLARYGYGLLLPEMRAELSLGPGAAGLISSASYASYLVANLAVVWVSGRLGPRVAVGLAAGSAAVGMALVATATSTPLLALGVLVAGAAAGFAFPPYADLVARHVRTDRRDVAWSAISSGTGWGVALAGPVAILAGAQWRMAWLVFVALAVLVGVLAVLLAPGRTRAPLRRPQLSWSWFLCPRSGPLLVSAVLVGTGSAVWWSFSVDALRDAGFDPTAARTVYAVCGVAGVVASLSGAVLARVGLRAGYLAVCGALAGSLALLAVGSDRLPVALLAAVVFGTCYNAVVAAHGIWSSRVFADHPAAGLAAVNSALTVGTLAGPALAGAAIGWWGYGWTLAGAAAVVLAALLCGPPGRRRRRRLADHDCRAAPVRP